MAPRIKKRNSRRKLGARPYKNYTPEMLEIALESVRNKTISPRDAEKQFGIPRRTIINKLKNLHSKAVGKPTMLTIEEENKLMNIIVASKDFGSPLSKLDVRILVHNYLKKNGKEKLFNGKMPGDKWINNFLSRHSEKLSVKCFQNINTSRTEKDENSDDETSDLWSYFERDGAGRARCAICCAKVYSHAASLTAHLKSKHPKLLSEPTSPQGSDHQNEDEEEETFTDIIYLEEETPKTKETPVKEKIDLSYSFKNQPSTSKNSGRKRSPSQSSDEIVYKKKRNASDRRETSSKKGTQDDDDTEIESFGSYVVCLLKKLPRKVSMKLQRDIINLIMNENLNEASNEMPNNIVLDGNKIYMVSNNDGTASKISDGTDTLENNSYDIKVTMNDSENQDSDARSAKNMLE